MELGTLADAPDGRLHVLCGLGGSGKTTVALTVAQAVAIEGQVWWITARDEASLTTDLVDLSAELGATAEEIRHAGAGVRSLIDLVWRSLEAMPGRWILVVDNADQPQLLAAEGTRVADGKGVVRGSARGLVLVTSRVGAATVWGSQAVLHPVGPLDDHDGGLVLCDLAPQAGNADQAKGLAARLGGLPLALHAAGRYLGSTRARLDRITTFAAYREALDAKFTAMLADATGLVAPREVLTSTWELSLDLLAGQGLPQARALMRLIGGFAPAPIPIDVLDRPALFTSQVFRLRHAPGVATQRLAAAARARIGAPIQRPDSYSRDLHRRVVESLRDLGLVDLTGGSASVDCLAAHPLVTEVNASWVADRRSLARAVHTTVAALLSQTVRGRDPHAASEFAVWPLLAPHLAHALTRAAPHLPRAAVVDLVDAACTTAMGLLRAGDQIAAYAIAATAVDSARRYLPADHPSGLAARSDVAAALKERGLHKQAEAEFRALLPVRERVLGSDHLDTLDTRHSYGDLLQHLGLHEQAEAEFRAVVSARERVLGAEHRGTLRARHNLADVHRRQGLHEQAETEFRAILDAQRRVLGDEHAHTLHTWHHLAEVLLLRGLTEDAEVEYQAALPILQRVLGAEHPDTLQIRYGLATVAAKRGLHDYALVEYQVVLATRERVLGAQHPEVAATRAAIDQLQASRSSAPD